MGRALRGEDEVFPQGRDPPEWQCPACGQWNDVAWKKCSACTAAKPAIGRVRTARDRPPRMAATGAPIWSWIRVTAFLLGIGSLVVFVAGTYLPQQVTIVWGGALGVFVLGILLASYDAAATGTRKRLRVGGLPAYEPVDLPRLRGPRTYAIVLISLALVVSGWIWYLDTTVGANLVVLRLLALIPLIIGLAFAAYHIGERRVASDRPPPR